MAWSAFILLLGVFEAGNTLYSTDNVFIQFSVSSLVCYVDIDASKYEFCDEFDVYLQPRRPMEMECLTGERLRAVIRKMCSKTTPGADSWKVAELKLLPVALLDRLAALLNLVEEHGVWPRSFAIGLISLVSKGEAQPHLS